MSDDGMIRITRHHAECVRSLMLGCIRHAEYWPKGGTEYHLFMNQAANYSRVLNRMVDAGTWFVEEDAMNRVLMGEIQTANEMAGLAEAEAQIAIRDESQQSKSLSFLRKLLGRFLEKRHAEKA